MDECNVVRRPRRWRAWAGAVVAAAVVVTGLAGTGVASADRPDHPVVLPPDATVHGRTFAQWSAEHWKWLYSMPASKHPLFDTADCKTGQRGDVWFLGGTFSAATDDAGVAVGIAERTCKVPSGKALFFPVVDSECATLELNPPPGEDLKTCAATFMDGASGLFATLDGVEIPDLHRYRVVSPPSIYGPLPEGSVIEGAYPGAVKGATSEFVSDGVFLMLAPLPKGEHTLRFGGSVRVAPQDGIRNGVAFDQDITYHLIVR